MVMVGEKVQMVLGNSVPTKNRQAPEGTLAMAGAVEVATAATPNTTRATPLTITTASTLANGGSTSKKISSME